MKLNPGDYVTLKSVEEVKHFYNTWTPVEHGCVIAGFPCISYFTEEMLDAMESSDMYRVEKVSIDGVWIDIDGEIWYFGMRFIKNVYRLVKIY